MNIPNFLTAMRVVMSVAVAILLCFNCKGISTLAFVLFVIAGVTDWFDGYIARRCNVVTNIGKFMDALCDKIMVIGLFLVLLGLDMFGENLRILAIFCAFFASAREFFVSGIRMLAATKSIVLAAEKLGKYKAALQMYAIGAVIYNKMMVADFGLDGFFLTWLGFYSGIAALVISTILSIISGVGYGVKYSYLLKG
ncbi:MAG: CDP-diacylglycerol--glycerol-3-phosphate 3-phosphatidyltransferase [Opitutales bacterium]|nr:CDP-diacylglycerol--glycerol-3-phosphate 3-phosphatidyltransferase [Opitutales bacterium]